MDAIPKMWWSGSTIRDLSPAFTGNTFFALAGNIEKLRSVSSTPRGLAVVPLVNTMDARASSSGSVTKTDVVSPLATAAAPRSSR